MSLHPLLSAGLALTLLGACAGPKTIVAAPIEAEPVSLEGWPSETFALPPHFAPELPTGSESLRFSPGWRDPSAEDFWSYAFVMSIDEPAPDAARVDELLEAYYDGLLSVFAGNAGQEVGSDPAQVQVQRLGPGRFEAQMHVIDAFATFEPKALRVVIDTIAEGDRRSAVCIQVSGQPAGHAIWRGLQAAIADIRDSDGVAPHDG